MKLKNLLEVESFNDFIKKLFGHKVFDILPDKLFLKIKYRVYIGKKLNLNNPVTFNEKLQWLKLHDRNSKYIQMVDKYKVKEYIAGTIGERYVIPLIDVWDSAELIDFDSLPNQFVLKCNHDSCSVVICRDKAKLDREKVRKRLASGLKRSGFDYGREWPYKKVKPCIIAEKYMEDNEKTDRVLQGELKDYKFFCFNGKVQCFKVDFDRFTEHRANYYDINCNLLPFGEVICSPKPEKKLVLPNEIPQMIELTEKLAKDIPFVRIDFYVTNHKIYFGEITFYPGSGFNKFTSDEWDKKLGDWLKLPNRS